MAKCMSIRNLDEETVSRLRVRAARHGRSAEAEARDILRKALADESAADFDTLAAQMRQLLAGRHYTPAEDLLRESRDER